MASFDEKTTPSPAIDRADSQTHSSDHDHEGDVPRGWMYQEHKLGFLTIPYYASPKAQLLLVAFVCFLCPGKPPSPAAHARVCATRWATADARC